VQGVGKGGGARYFPEPGQKPEEAVGSHAEGAKHAKADPERMRKRAARVLGCSIPFHSLRALRPWREALHPVQAFS
jgi:hypothetical protein